MQQRLLIKGNMEKNLKNLFSPKSIAIVGASEEEGKVGNVIAKNILGANMREGVGKYQGKTYLVNSRHKILFDQKCYENLSEIKEDIDMAVIAIPAKFVNQVIKEASNKIKNFAVISAGFGEIGGEGKAREDELKKIAEENGLNILGPNCLGFIVPESGLNASFAGGMPEAGNIAFISQSGALAVALMDVARNRNLKFSNIVSVGNKLQIDESLLLEYLAEDQKTKVIGMYLEGIKDGKKFLEVAAKVSKIKPIVVLKSGKTERAQKAISSHTGALAGSDEIMNAVFEKTGVIRAENMDEFLNLLELISATDAPKNEKVVVATNAGGLGVLTTDAFQNKKIILAEISEKAKSNLKKFLPAEASVANPIDILGDADEKRYGKALDAIKKENADTVVCLLTPQDQTPVAKIASKISKFKEKSKKNTIAVFMGGNRVEKAAKKLKENGIPCFFLPEQAIGALDKYYRWNLASANAPFSQIECENIERKNRSASIISNVRSQGRSALLFAEAAEIMKAYGINVVKTSAENSSEVVFPVAVKVDSDKVLHKTDKQGLILNIQNNEELKTAIEKIKNNFPEDNFIIQPMQKIQTELILGIKKDDIFGPIVVFGLGGIYTEVFRMVDFLVPPASSEEIKKKLLEGKLRFLFQETRGQKPYNLDEAARFLGSAACLAQEITDIKELDINPFLVYNNGSEGVAVDVKIII